MSHLLAPLLQLHGQLAYALVAALTFGEAAIFVGFVLPGETAVVLGGVLASMGRVSLPVMIVVVVVAAILGDSVGFEVGRHYGPRVLELSPLRRRRAAIGRAQAYLRDNGGHAVFLGRFTAFLRAVTPGLAGVSQMPYRRFLLYNAAGGIAWGSAFTLLGFLAGASYERVAKLAGRASIGVLALLVVLLVLGYRRHRRKERALLDDPARSEAAASRRGG